VTSSPRRGTGVGTIVGTLALIAACPHDPPILDDPATTSGDDPSTSSPTTGAATTGAACDQLVCLDGAAIPCDGGVPGAPTPCDGECIDGLGCAACEPGTFRCGDDGVERCDDVGVWVLQEACNAAQGFTCDVDTGACVGVCHPDALAGRGHHGCEFYAASIAAVVNGDEVFGVLVTNPGDEPAMVTASRPLWAGSLTEVPPHATVQIFLPWTQHLLTALDISTVASAAAVHLQSDRPVSVVQHSPLIPDTSADASLLLPVNAWGSHHFVAGAASQVSQFEVLYPGVVAVVAARDGTTVELAPRPGLVVFPGDGVAPDGSGVVVLGRGDVLQVVATTGQDLTGSAVSADGPIAVIAGHYCAYVPLGTYACDHLEETMLPTAQLGTRHAVVPPMALEGQVRRAQVVRIVATEDLTDLTFDPPQDIQAMLVFAGDFLDIPPSAAAFVVEATRPVLVAQYMVGREWDDNGGDPSLTIATPVERFRDDHTVAASPYWPVTAVDVVAPADAIVELDGELLVAWTQIGASDLAFAHVRFASDSDEAHTITADKPIGASVYGPGLQFSSTSYWHPAGYSFAVDE
jgi:hypothetical protein